MKVLLKKATKTEKKAGIGDRFGDLGFLALALGPALGYTTAGITNHLSKPGEADMNRIRMLELAVRYERAAAGAEQRALQRLGGNA